MMKWKKKWRRILIWRGGWDKGWLIKMLKRKINLEHRWKNSKRLKILPTLLLLRPNEIKPNCQQKTLNNLLGMILGIAKQWVVRILRSSMLTLCLLLKKNLNIVTRENDSKIRKINHKLVWMILLTLKQKINSKREIDHQKKEKIRVKKRSQKLLGKIRKKLMLETNLTNFMGLKKRKSRIT